MTRLEQTIDEMAEHYRLIGGRARANRFVLFTNLDRFNAKIERKPLGEIYPDYRHYLSEISEETVRARRFIFDKLIANQFKLKESWNRRSELQCILHDVSRSFDVVLKDIYQRIKLADFCSTLLSHSCIS